MGKIAIIQMTNGRWRASTEVEHGGVITKLVRTGHSRGDALAKLKYFRDHQNWWHPVWDRYVERRPAA